MSLISISMTADCLPSVCANDNVDHWIWYQAAFVLFSDPFHNNCVPNFLHLKMGIIIVYIS